LRSLTLAVAQLSRLAKSTASTLMQDSESETLEVGNNTVDYVVAGTKAVLGIVPFAGSLLAEIAGSIIPNQRVDRIVKFSDLLQQRIAHLEQDTVRMHLTDEHFTELVEESLRQAARSTSDERRAYLASALAASLTSENRKHSEAKHLLRIMGELSDIEIIWLRFYQQPTIGGDEVLREKHAAVLERKPARRGSPPEDLDQHAFQVSYRDHLVDLGLLTPTISRGRDRLPEFDAFSGNFKISYYRTSPLGNLLLRTIGYADEDERLPSTNEAELVV
jgi:hypothetical protein